MPRKIWDNNRVDSKRIAIIKPKGRSNKGMYYVKTRLGTSQYNLRDLKAPDLKAWRRRILGGHNDEPFAPPLPVDEEEK